MTREEYWKSVETRLRIDDSGSALARFMVGPGIHASERVGLSVEECVKEYQSLADKYRGKPWSSG